MQEATQPVPSISNIEPVEIKDTGVINGFRTLSFVFKNSTGSVFIAKFKARTIYDNSMQKMFKRLIPLKDPTDV